uniref:G-protein subunit alpha 8 n=1 Tax=Hirondellea gigas TaxID=1518452 RepID=A0A6A7GB75_9CRUS
MGTFCSRNGGIVEEDPTTANIDRGLEEGPVEDRIKKSLHFKILLLGAGESGKSTVVKQLRNIYLGELAISPEEIRSYASVLHTNTIQAMKVLIRGCERLKIPLGEMQTLAKYIMDLDEQEPLLEEDAATIGKLWKSVPLQKAYSQKSRVYVPDSAAYYFENILRFVTADFLPSEEDILMARIRTTGMFMTAFDSPPVHWRVVDLGGQRSERKKWIRFFDDVEAILFVVNLAGYNQVLFEDQSKNRMVEALELFEEISKHHCFRETPVFLFLNKKDIFEQCLNEQDISCCFPEYDGEKTTMAQMEFIHEQFRRKMPDKKELTCTNYIAACCRKDVRYAFEDVKENLIKHNQKRIRKGLKKQSQLNSQPNS